MECFSYMIRFDPYQVFRSSKTPVGLYARQKWIGEEKDSRWKSDLDASVGRLLAGQSADGSWNQSMVSTIQRLFGLHLTVRNPTEPINKALDWLMAVAFKELARIRKDFREQITSQDLENLPLTTGYSGYFVSGAALFLASIFGREKDPRVLETYEWLNEEGIKKNGRWCGWSCSNNILRAFVVHPEYSKSRATELAVHALASAQDPSGKWPAGVPFYQTVNALAHLASEAADAQLDRAFKQLRVTQNRDGTWGRSQKEWKTFLVVHAMRRKGVMWRLRQQAEKGC
jgi:hypothetical protein